jgi:hypothetical protein
VSTDLLLRVLVMVGGKAKIDSSSIKQIQNRENLPVKIWLKMLLNTTHYL